LAIDASAALEEYKARVAASGEKLVRNYTKRTDKLTKAASDSAQRAYVAAMSDPKVQARRQKKLRQLSESDLNSAMEAVGATTYATNAAAKADKWAKNVAPFLQELDNVVSKLPDRTRDPAQNVVNRVVPIAKALSAKKDALG
jgi:gas vesicle protein